MYKPLVIKFAALSPLLLFALKSIFYDHSCLFVLAVCMVCLHCMFFVSSHLPICIFIFKVSVVRAKERRLIKKSSNQLCALQYDSLCLLIEVFSSLFL